MRIKLCIFTALTPHVRNYVFVLFFGNLKIMYIASAMSAQLYFLRRE